MNHKLIRCLITIAIVSISLSLLQIRTAAAYPYDRLDGLGLNTSSPSIIVVGNMSVTYTYSADHLNSKSHQILGDAIYEASSLILRELDKLGIKYSSCSHKHNIGFYEVSISTLNNKAIFPKERYYPNGQILYAVWEPMNSDLDIIVLSRSNNKRSFLGNVSHEVSHYWYNRLMLDKTSNFSHEEFAVYIENIFVKNIRSVEYE